MIVSNDSIMKPPYDITSSILQLQTPKFTTADRIAYFLSMQGKTPFSRKDNLRVFKDISTATASRDLKYAVDKGLVEKMGDKRLSRYRRVGE